MRTLIVLLTMAVAANVALAQEQVNFADPNLEAAVREELGIPVPTPIYPDDMLGLTDLGAYNAGIVSLVGLEHAANLTVLRLRYNQISDLSPISGLTNLIILNLGHNLIVDIPDLSALTNLTLLDLGSNQISDFPDLSGLTNLTDLYLPYNQISVIPDLSGLTNLTVLDLGTNNISDISALSALTNLTSLGLSANPTISDYSPLSGLTNLTHLHLSCNQISDISPVSGLTNLTHLNLGENLIEDINALSGLTNLTVLNLGTNNISDISALSELTNLTQLALCWNQISNLEPLSGMTSLMKLLLSNNQISDISPISDLMNLVNLDLIDNPLDCLAYDIYIPQIIENNPGIRIYYDPRPDECPFQVNTETAGDQQHPAVAMDADGDFVVTWESLGQDGDGWGIYAQRYNRDGTPDGNEFKVNTYTAYDQEYEYPCVAMDADGDFVIAWQSWGQDGWAWGIYARRYDSNGTPDGNEFQVNTETESYQEQPSVAMDADGDFVIAWQSWGQDGSATGIYAQRYNSDGTPAVGYNSDGTPTMGEFLVNTETEYYQEQPSVAMDADGDFVIAWGSRILRESGQSDFIYDIHAQRYNSDGTLVGLPIDVLDDDMYTQRQPSVAMDADGDFVIAWQRYSGVKAWDIHGQMYDSNGAPDGNEFQVNTETENWQTSPSVAMDADGDFVITWQSNLQDGSGYGIYCQWYSSDGTAVGGEFPVNTETENWQTSPSVAMDADGNSVIGWQSYGQDGDGYGIYARMFSAGAGGRVEEVRLVIDYTSNVISGLILDEPEVFMNDVVMYTLEATIQEVGELLVLRTASGPYEEALKILEKKVLPKMDGCAVSGSPENGDWIITCEAQGQVYPSVVEAIELLEELVGP